MESSVDVICSVIYILFLVCFCFRATRRVSPGLPDYLATCFGLWDTLDYCPTPRNPPQERAWPYGSLNSCRRHIPDLRHGTALPDQVGDLHMVTHGVWTNALLTCSRACQTLEWQTVSDLQRGAWLVECGQSGAQNIISNCLCVPGSDETDSLWL